MHTNAADHMCVFVIYPESLWKRRFFHIYNHELEYRHKQTAQSSHSVGWWTEIERMNISYVEEWKKLQRQTAQTKTNVDSTQLNEWNRKCFFLFDYIPCSYEFTWLFCVWCVDYLGSDECVCYLCMIFLFHFTFPERMIFLLYFFVHVNRKIH